MADMPATTAHAVWNITCAQREELIHNLKQSQNLNRDPQLEQRLAAAEEQLLQLEAPDMAGVTLKLELLWDAQLHGLDDESRQRLLILSDIQRLAL